MILQGDAREIPLADGSVHCVVTSPPYWGLRDYGIDPLIWGGDPGCAHEWGSEVPRDRRGGSGPNAKECYARTDGEDEAKTTYARQVPRGNFCQRCDAWRGSLGLEPTPELYVQHLVEVFREVRRVLRDDGTLWMNMGDSYANDGKWGGVTGGKHVEALHGATGIGRQKVTTGLKPKDLVGIPWRVAFALQSDGWWLRSEITWCKRAPMPESVEDRPTSATEKVFLLSKSARYFYDAEAVKEPSGSGPSDQRKMLEGYERFGGRAKTLVDPLNKASSTTNIGRHAGVGSPSGRNMRNFWLLGPSRFDGAHFATFPRKLVEFPILAATSARGCCAKCGAPWERVVEQTGHVNRREPTHQPGNTPTKVDSTGWKPTSRGTDAWRPTCSCSANVVPAIVLDPFGGSMTTVAVAESLGRRGIGMDLKWEYLILGRQRMQSVTMGLPL